MLSWFLNVVAVGAFCLLGFVWVVAQTDQLTADEAAVAANIKALHSEKSEVREAAAKELRRIIAKYPSGTSNIRSKDGGEAYWTERVNQVVPGMTESEVSKILPARPGSGDGMGLGSGQSLLALYRLDSVWMVAIQYRNPDKVIDTPKLTRREELVNIPPPENFTGIWKCWHVNGQKGRESNYREGKFDGVVTVFHDNGRPWYEQHYIMSVAEGTDTGWYPDGKFNYTGNYKNGKQDGQWLHYYPNGVKSSEMNFTDGKLNGLHAGWYENGQMRSEVHYLNGIQNGVEAAWNEQGVLQYKRERKNGQVVAPSPQLP